MAQQLAELGPRPSESSTHANAARMLLEWMRDAGLERVEALPSEGRPGRRNLTGVLPGGADDDRRVEIVLSAHYDTVGESAGAVDNAAGVAVVLAAARRLADLPRAHAVRVLLFDGEELDLAGSAVWIEALTADQRNRILALINVDLVGWHPEGPGVARLSLARSERGLRLAPAWLVHAVVRSTRAVADPLRAATARWSLLGQLHARSFRSIFQTDADVVMGVGVPALTVTEADPLEVFEELHTSSDNAELLEPVAVERWVERLMAMTRRLDALGGRPRDDDQYLVVASRVLTRRDLYWINLAVWIALVFLGLPGRWRGERTAIRSRRGRNYLAGFTQRVLYLGAILMLPVFSTILLLPAAVVSAISTRLPIPGLVARALALLPLGLYLLFLARLAAQGTLGQPALGLPAALLLAGSLGSLVWPLGETAPIRD